MPVESPSPSVDETLSTLWGLAIGLLLMVGGLWVQQIHQREQVTLKEVQGTVVDTISRRERDATTHQEKITYAPVIEFPVTNDRTRFTGKYESYRVSNGKPVVVRYNPQQPATTAQVVDPLEGWTPWAMVGIGGLSVFWSLTPLLLRWTSGCRRDR
ncbi:DUF3592 domain-containing protein [Pantanalinema sp. GBBB05]|uniref:DUF3592 domain-containing protein n=1 Tax=Pantanalinema sp. GBBB05 TaxID=2604139 RepID=UPI001DB86F87|nr:DUF3592 domain-containing protein [Pantanalinema sp. GBBB05]